MALRLVIRVLRIDVGPTFGNQSVFFQREIWRNGFGCGIDRFLDEARMFGKPRFGAGHQIGVGMSSLSI